MKFLEFAINYCDKLNALMEDICKDETEMDIVFGVITVLFYCVSVALLPVCFVLVTIKEQIKKLIKKLH